MGIIDAAITLSLTSFGFFVGFLARGLFSEGSSEDQPAIESRSGQYEPPRRVERI